MAYTSPEQPLCHYCGKPIAKSADTYYVVNRHKGETGLGNRKVEGPLYSKAECQRTVNGKVISLSYSQDINWNTDKSKGPRYVHSFGVWDGESYIDEFFCNGTCTRRFAYLMARAGRCTNVYSEAIERRQAKRGAA